MHFTESQWGSRASDRHISLFVSVVEAIIYELHKGFCFQHSRDQPVSHSFWHADTEKRGNNNSKMLTAKCQTSLRHSSFPIISQLHIVNHELSLSPILSLPTNLPFFKVLAWNKCYNRLYFASISHRFTSRSLLLLQDSSEMKWNANEAFCSFFQFFYVVQNYIHLDQSHHPAWSNTQA